MLKCLIIPQIPDFKWVCLSKAPTKGDLCLKRKKGEKKKKCIYTHFYCDVQRKQVLN